MAVNNFAPAEFGGYVLGVNGSGGGGGLSPFDEWLGVTGYAEVILNYTFPEGSEDTGLSSGSYRIVIGTFDEWNTMYESYNFYISNPELIAGSGSMTIIVPIIEGKTSVLYDFAVDGNEGGYYTFDLADTSFTENISSVENYITVSGDGTITTTLVS